MVPVTRWQISLVLALGMTLAAPTPLEAFHIGNPLKAVGNAVGGVLRGIGGVFGQGLAGFAGPTIDEAGNKFQSVANDAIGAADAAAGRRIEQFADRLTTLINQQDEILTKHIAEIDDILTRKLGAADIIGTKQINNFEQSIIEVVKYTSVLFLVSACLFTLFSILIRLRAADRYEKLAIPQLLGACSLLATVSLISLGASVLLNPPSAGRMVALSKNLYQSYQYSMQLGDLSGARFYASQLNALDLSNFATRLLVDVADLQRDLLLRPALFKTPKGALELSTRLGRIDRTWDLAQESKVDTTPVDFLEYELPAVTSLVIWQTAASEGDEITAACSALAAMDAFSKHRTAKGTAGLLPESASPYVWMAYAYSKWEQVRLPAGGRCPNSVPLSELVAQVSPVIKAFDGARPNPIVEHVMKYDQAAIEYYYSASRAYSTMLVNDAQFHFKTTPGDKGPFKAERDRAADVILNAWKAFTGTAKGDLALHGNNIVLAATGMPAALALRAAALKGQDGRPGFDVNNCNNVVSQLSAPDPNVRTAAANTAIGSLLVILDQGVRYAACADQSAWDLKLVQFESALSDTYGLGKTTPIEKKKMLDSKQEFKSIATSLLACIVVDDASMGGDRECRADEQSTNLETLADWMQAGQTYDQGRVTRVAFIR